MAKKLRLPAILMAQDLLEGHPLVWADKGWANEFENAVIINNEQEIADFEQIIFSELAKNQILDAQLVEVTIDENGAPLPRNYRTAIQIKGPTIKYGAQNV